MKRVMIAILCLITLSSCAVAEQTATATVEGVGEHVTVTLTMEDDRIKSVEAVSDNAEADERGKEALSLMTNAIVEKNSFAVDTISGATCTSNAVIAGAIEAWMQIRTEEMRQEDWMICPRLVKTVTEYGVDFETEEWTALRTWDYAYENGYPVSVDLHELDTDTHAITTFSYVFENGEPIERRAYDSDGTLLSVAEYRNGCIYNVYEENDFSKYALYYQYGNADGYFTLVLKDERSHDAEAAEGIDDYAEEVDAISVTTKNGLLAKTVNTGMYANWGGEEAKEWLRFSGTYTADYDGDGIIAVASALHRVGPSGIECRYELTKADGAVIEGIRYDSAGENDWFSTSRFTFEYTDTETTAARYAQMINSFLMGSENSYYKYNWY